MLHHIPLSICTSISYADGTNNYVQVHFIEKRSNFVCQFLNQQGVHVKQGYFKSCSIRYGKCPQMLLVAKDDSTDSLDKVTLVLQVDHEKSREYCYLVNASTDAFTIQVEGEFVLHSTEIRNTILGRILGSGVVVVGTVLIGIIIILVIRCYKLKSKYYVESTFIYNL